MNQTNKQIATLAGGFLMMQKLQQKILAEFRKKCEYRFRNIKFANTVSIYYKILTKVFYGKFRTSNF